MKIIAILEVDCDDVLDAHGNPDSSLEFAIEGELGWVEASGISVSNIIAPDSLSPNDVELGKMIRDQINN